MQHFKQQSIGTVLVMWSFIQNTTESFLMLISFNQMDFAVISNIYDFHCYSEMVLIWVSWPLSRIEREEAFGKPPVGQVLWLGHEILWFLVSLLFNERATFC